MSKTEPVPVHIVSLITGDPLDVLRSSPNYDEATDSINAPKALADRWRAQQAFGVLRTELVEKPLTPLVTWLDRQLRRSPRLYRWLSR